MTLESISVSETSLTFDYTVNNYGPFPVYLMNNLSHPSEPGALRVQQDLVYSWFSAGDSLSLAKQLLIPSDEIKHASYFIPFVSILEPHWTMTETVQLPLPIELYHPYGPVEDVGQLEQVTQFTFTLGYVLGDRPVHTEELVLADGNRHTRIDYQEAVDRQRLKHSRPVRALIPISRQKMY